ncbi:hypothetical protein MMC10_002605 [Thelotrema lepadinum]|nr:hypothetical protein [Thelotrema lepadinum]
MNAVDFVLPGFVPKPLALGTFASDLDIHFYLMDFVDMSGEIPSPDSLCSKVVEMHKNCLSSNGKYGFVVSTNMGALIQPNEWNNSWEDFFSKTLQRCFDFEQGMHGQDEEMQNLHTTIMEKVIPRLLRPLETGGNEIQPCLVHGDLWHGNASISA